MEWGRSKRSWDGKTTGATYVTVCHVSAWRRMMATCCTTYARGLGIEVFVVILLCTCRLELGELHGGACIGIWLSKSNRLSLDQTGGKTKLQKLRENSVNKVVLEKENE